MTLVHYKTFIEGAQLSVIALKAIFDIILVLEIRKCSMTINIVSIASQFTYIMRKL